MLFSIFYFSGTGNTRWAVEQLNGILTGMGHTCNTYSIDFSCLPDPESVKAIINRSDYIGFAYPIYGANLPPIMIAFIESINRIAELKDGNPKNLFLISTVGYIDSFGPLAAKQLFKHSGLRLRGYLSLRISNNISTPKIKSNPISPDELEKRKKTAVCKLTSLAERLLEMEPFITGIGPYLIPGIFIRRFTAKGIGDNYLSLGIKTDTCEKCMLCVNNCPTNSIIYKDGEFSFKNSCTACMRCYNFCPTYSITFDGKYAEPEEYYRYKGIK